MRRVRLVFVTAVAAVLTGCSLDFGGSRGSTRQGRDIFGLWQGSVIVALCVGGLVWGLIVFAVFRYRRRNDVLPTQTQYVIKLEIFYTVVPIVIVAVLFAFSFRVQHDVDKLPAHPAVTVRVSAFQWQWQFHYVDEDITVTGLPGKAPVMVLPINRPVELIVTARDVAHSFYVPDFLYKRDAIPGVTNKVPLTIERKGTFEGRCAEFCGLDHARMDFSVKGVTMSEYRDWVGRQQTRQETASA